MVIVYDYNINILTEGNKYLGCPLGNAEYCQKFTTTLVAKFEKQLRNRSIASITYSQCFYSMS